MSVVNHPNRSRRGRPGGRKIVKAGDALLVPPVTVELFAMFTEQDTARSYLERRRWPKGPRCPVCGHGDRITARESGFYRCNLCNEDFTVLTGTVFEHALDAVIGKVLASLPKPKPD